MKVFRLLFVGALSSFAVAAYGVTPQQQAFAQAQALANGAQAGAVASVGGGSVAATVSKFNPTYYNASGNAPESALFQ
ncbi:MAG: hypothetical protein ACXWTX_03805, partial [Gallionella sp.]